MTQLIEFTPIHAIVKDYPDNKYPRLVKSRIATNRVLGSLGIGEAQYLIHRYDLKLSDTDKAVVG